MVSTADDLLPSTTAGENVGWPLGYASVQPDCLTAAGVGEITQTLISALKSLEIPKRLTIHVTAIRI
jgi:hypothetical protein